MDSKPTKTKISTCLFCGTKHEPPAPTLYCSEECREGKKEETIRLIAERFGSPMKTRKTKKSRP